MKELVMKVKHFFNVKDKDGIVLTILGGSLNCNINCRETVEIHTINDVLKISIEEIKCYNKNLDEALSGLSCGLAFSGISYMQFRVTEPIINPHDPKKDLVKFLEYERQGNVAEGVMILREVYETSKEQDSKGNYPKPNFLFLYGSE